MIFVLKYCIFQVFSFFSKKIISLQLANFSIVCDEEFMLDHVSVKLSNLIIPFENWNLWIALNPPTNSSIFGIFIGFKHLHAHFLHFIIGRQAVTWAHIPFQAWYKFYVESPWEEDFCLLPPQHSAHCFSVVFVCKPTWNLHRKKMVGMCCHTPFLFRSPIFFLCVFT